MAGRRLPALLALNSVAVIWGSQHAVIKTLVWASLTSDAPITLINSLRFTLAAVTTATLSACRACRACRARAMGHAREARIGDAPPTGLLRAAAELALWLVAGFTLQLVGLQWTSASRSAFLLYLNAVLVPFLACLMGERNIGLRTWVTAFAAVSGVPQHTHTHMHTQMHPHTHNSTCACACCTCTAQRAARALHMSGTLLLTHDGGPPNPGDVFSLGAAAASALYIVRLSALSAGHEAARLSAATLALSGAACMGITLAQAAAAGNLSGLALQVVARHTHSIRHARHAHAHAQRRRQHTRLHTHALHDAACPRHGVCECVSV
jgi:drug/metabolite transporter (DMT)-like permease